MWSKVLRLSVSEATEWLAVQRKAQASHYRLGKLAFVKENAKTSLLKKSVKSLRYTDEFFFRWITTTWKLPAMYNCEV